MQQVYRGIYLCLGYPSLEQSLGCLDILGGHSGIDFIELGLPFSDPIADGPVIAAAAQEALSRAAERKIPPQQMLEQALEVLGCSRQSKDLYLMTYGNIVYQLQQQYGCGPFNKLPLAGLIIPDLPLREQAFFREKGLSLPMVPFATPETTAEDLQLLGRGPARSAPFVYFVAVRGITGSQTDFGSKALRQQYARVLAIEPQRPVVVGFGVQDRTQIEQLAEFANGFVIGTAAVRLQVHSKQYRDFLDAL